MPAGTIMVMQEINRCLISSPPVSFNRFKDSAPVRNIINVIANKYPDSMQKACTTDMLSLSAQSTPAWITVPWGLKSTVHDLTNLHGQIPSFLFPWHLAPNRGSPRRSPDSHLGTVSRISIGKSDQNIFFRWREPNRLSALRWFFRRFYQHIRLSNQTCGLPSL